MTKFSLCIGKRNHINLLKKFCSEIKGGKINRMHFYIKKVNEKLMFKVKCITFINTLLLITVK